MTVFFTADLHLGHARVIEYCRRPFKHVDEMNKQLIARWNARVSNHDDVYILGDVALCRPEQALAFVRGLNGRKFLVFGNHDKPNRKHYDRSEAVGRNGGLFEWLKDLAQVKIPDVDAPNGVRQVVLCHYPLMTWNKSHHGSWHLHGHCHGSLKDDSHSRRIDVGVDCHDYAPVSYDEVKALMAKKLWKPIDHHGAD